MSDHIASEHAHKCSRLYRKCEEATPGPILYYGCMTETRGNRIRYLRKSKKLTQEQLADRIGVTKSLVSQWERNAIGEISHRNWMALLAELSADPEFLEFGSDPPKALIPASTPGANTWRKKKR